MHKYQTKTEFNAYLLCTNYPEELQKTMLNAIETVETATKGGAESYLIIAEDEAQARAVEKEYALSGCYPESDTPIPTENGEVWRERVFIFSDDGGGIIYFERVKNSDEK